MNKTITGYFDGCCEPKNPGGNMGIGSVLFVAGVEVFSYSHFVPESYDNTNNVAEYRAFHSLLEFIKKENIEGTRIHIFGDSQLVINQMSGRWRIKFGRYTSWADRCKTILKELKENNRIQFVLNWIPRDQNEYADKLSKQELVKNKIEFKIQPQHG